MAKKWDVDLSSLPLTELFVREKEGTFATPGPDVRTGPVMKVDDDKRQVAAPSEIVFSPDGNRIAIIDAGVNIIDAASGEVVLRIDHPPAAIAAWSPKGTYIQTWEKLTEEAQSSGGNNVVWNATTGERVAAFPHKLFSKDLWPLIKWSSDEAVAVRLVTNQVAVYDGTNLRGGQTGGLRLESVSKCSIAPGPAPYKIATFTPENKGRPAQVRLYRHPNLGDGEQVATKSAFRATNVDFLWNPLGASLLVKTTTDVDATGKSYYGESFLAFLSADGSVENNVALGKDGPIHDVEWSPTGEHFVAVFGFMPAKATMFDAQCRPVFDFGTGSRNTVRWSPHGRFLMLGGFGNIAGHMEFWDKNKQNALGNIKQPSVTPVGWSPDSRYFLTAICFPRLRVDNGFQICKYNGTPVFARRAPTELYQVAWRPVAEGVYADRPVTPPKLRQPIPEGAPTTLAEAAAAAGGAVEAPARPALAGSSGGSYVPPHLRGKGGASAPARPSFTLHDYEAAQRIDTRPAAVAAASGPIGAQVVQAKPSKSALKNAKRRAKAKEAEAAAPADAPAPAPAAPAEVDPAKRAKALQKKLRQIDDLVAKRDAGTELNAEQQEKIDSKGSIEAELASLKL